MLQIKQVYFFNIKQLIRSYSQHLTGASGPSPGKTWKHLILSNLNQTEEKDQI